MLIWNKFNGFSFDGSRRAFMGGGGGGGGQQAAVAPANQRVEQTSIPDYARPYVEAMLGKTAALTDINQNPYQPYSGQRIAGFTPLQAQGFSNVANQQVAGQIGEGSNLASQVGQTALGAFGQGQQLGQAAQGYGGQGAGYGAQGAQMAGMGFGAGQRFENMATSPGATQNFMSPYMQNVVDFQKQNAIRDFGIASQGRNAQAVKSGAFGGSRQAVAEGEANRALMNQLGGIQATGTQQAFENAQKQMQFGADLGLRGLGAGYQGLGLGIQGAQTGLQGIQGATAAGQYGLQGLGESTRAAQLLGQLGQSQFGQQRDITNDMMRAGAVQQGQQQQGLDVAYQDFTKAQNYPYQQLAFGSDMLRGLPLSQASQSIYNAPPSAASQIGGLGTTALGIYGMSGGFKANGGMVGKGYAEGGQIGYSKGGDISMLNLEQLTKMLENPSLDPMEVAMIEDRIMLLTRMKNNPEAAGIMTPRQQTAGIDSIPTGDMVPEQMAGGGIVAFSKGGLKRPEDEMDYRDMIRKRLAAQETADPFTKSQEEVQAIRKEMAERKDRAPYEALAMAGLGAMSGTSPYALTNIGLGGIEGMKTYGRSMTQDAADKKLLLQQQVEAEKSKYARDTGNLNALIQAQGQKDTKEIGLLNARQYGAATNEAAKARAFNQAQVGYLDAIDKAKKSIVANNKYEGLSDAKIDEMARDSVNANLSPQFKKILFGDIPINAPVATAAPLAMPKSKSDLVKGSVYNTARGPATWDGTQFVAGK